MRTPYESTDCTNAPQPTRWQEAEESPTTVPNPGATPTKQDAHLYADRTPGEARLGEGRGARGDALVEELVKQRSELVVLDQEPIVPVV